jgi:type II secretory pathway pseudopilin PulG
MKSKTRILGLDVVVTAIILGVIAMLAVPQFTEANTEAQVSELVDGLETMRIQLDLYRAQHGGNLPPTESFADFETAMTTKIGRYGPYLNEIPANPFSNLNTVRFDGEPAGARKAGWRLDTESGLFQADTGASYAVL